MRASGRPLRARLGANESVFGPSPMAIEAMERAARDAWMYGDSESHDLRAALAQHHGVAAENIVVGEGIDGLLGLLVRLLVAPGDRVVTSDGAYPTFDYHVAGFGGVLHKTAYRDDRADPVALVLKAEELGAKIVYLANPDNPMGGWHSARVVSRMLDALPKASVLVLDEAYADFAPPEALPPFDLDDPRLIRLRTFSKAYGLAGVRMGYAVGAAPVIAMFDRVRNHFGVTRVGQAGALAALADQGWLETVVAQVAAARARLAEIADAQGLFALPSATNFVAIDCGQDGAFARRVLAGMMGRDVFVRMPGVAPLDRCIRVSAGRAQDLDVFADAFAETLAEAAR